jgi:nitrogen fixation protein NifU and related proteins
MAGGEILLMERLSIKMAASVLVPREEAWDRAEGSGKSMYSPQVLDHFENPRNAGTVADADAAARIENPACGDVLELTVKIAEGRIAEIRFRAKGCVAAVACGSAVTELVSGRRLDEAKKLSRDELVRAVGGLPAASTHASHLAMDALAAVLGKIPG